MGIRKSELYGPVGIWLLFAGLVLGLIWEIVLFPVWEGTHSMRVLLGYVAPYPLLFVLERTGPTAAILGLIGAALVEKGRPRPVNGIPGWWNRERFLVVTAALYEGVFLLSILSPGGFTFGVPREEKFFIQVVAGLVVSVSLGLYLLWTAERISGISVTLLGSIAIAFSILAWALESLYLADLFLLVDSPSFSPASSISAWLFGAVSVAVWVAIYGRIMLRGIKPPPSKLPVAREA